MRRAMQRQAIAKSVTAIIIVVVLIVAGVAAYYFISNSGSQTQSTTLMLDFTQTGYHALFYYGLANGVYSHNGINLTILAGSGSGNTVAAVAAGKIDFGFADTGTLAVAAATQNVSNVRVVAMVLQNTPGAIIYNKADISSPKDLSGKTMGTFQGNGQQKMFSVFASLNGINATSVTPTYVAPSAFNQLVALGKVDFVPTTINQMANIGPIAAQNNIQLGVFPYPSYGLNVYGAAIITNTNMLNSHPDLVKKFVQATMESVLGAVQHPQAAINGLVQYNPQLNSTKALEDFELVVTNCLPQNVNSTSNALTLGWIDQTKMQNTINLVSQAYGISTPPSATNLFTDQYVQAPS